jgi:hypothetical protein
LAERHIIAAVFSTFVVNARTSFTGRGLEMKHENIFARLQLGGRVRNVRGFGYRKIIWVIHQSPIAQVENHRPGGLQFSSQWQENMQELQVLTRT